MFVLGNQLNYIYRVSFAEFRGFSGFEIFFRYSRNFIIFYFVSRKKSTQFLEISCFYCANYSLYEFF